MAEGYKAWSGGAVLDAQDLTDYASSQAVMRFANAAGRDAALTVSVVKEGMLAYLKDSNILTVNTDGTTSGWVQIYPVVTAGITDGNVTNAKLAANSVSSSNIIDGTITGTDIASATIQPGNLASGTYSINITGSASSATTASNADTLDGYNTSTTSTADTVAVRSGIGAIEAFSYTATGGSIGAFRDTGTYTYIGFGTARVINSTDVYNQAVSGRTVLINSNLTLGTSTSSARFKEDIETLDYEPADILQLRPVSFRYKENHLEPGADRPVELGLIAEEVAALGFEELIFRDKNGQPDGIAYEKLAVPLLKLVQHQQTQLDALAARLDQIGA